MTSTKDALKLICQHNDKWLDAFNDSDMLEYILIADIGRDLIDFISDDKEHDLLQKVFKTVENILSDCDIEVSSLIGAGMFEAMQNAAYDILEPPDKTNNYLKEKSQKLWNDIIEGWTGVGVLTIDQWKRVLISSGKFSLKEKYRFEFTDCGEVFEISYEDLRNVMVLPFFADSFEGNIKGIVSPGQQEVYLKISKVANEKTPVLITGTAESDPEKRYVIISDENALLEEFARDSVLAISVKKLYDIREKLRINSYDIEDVDEIYEDHHFGIDIVKFKNYPKLYISYWVDIFDDHLQFHIRQNEEEINKLLSLIKAAESNVNIQSVICSYIEDQKRVIKYSSNVGFEIRKGTEYILSGPPW